MKVEILIHRFVSFVLFLSVTVCFAQTKASASLLPYKEDIVGTGNKPKIKYTYVKGPTAAVRNEYAKSTSQVIAPVYTVTAYTSNQQILASIPSVKNLLDYYLLCCETVRRSTIGGF